MDLESLGAIADKLGTVLLLVAIVAGAILRRWHTHGEFTEVVTDRDFWRTQALTLLNGADRTVTLLEKRQAVPQQVTVPVQVVVPAPAPEPTA